MNKVIFVSGIDTDAGKSYATGWLAARLMNEGKSVVTQKFIQTGCDDSSEDIDVHRAIMGCGLLPDDLDRTTAPIIYHYPASAQLAARLDGADRIPVEKIEEATARLSSRYDHVLVEGAGGLAVPITDTYLAIDYIADHNLPVALVTNSRLGSINHTVLSLEALKSRNIELECVLFNHYFDGDDSIIADDTRQWIERYVTREFPGVPVLDVPAIAPNPET